MIRSMFTAISSLHLQQYFMDVVADNLANANTNGFKAGRFSFQDQFSQTMSVGSAPSGDLGGVNPSQIGLGVRMGSTSPTFSQGSLQTTGRNTDMALQGEGFFIYSSGSTNFYSRDGMLDMDAQGFLVHSSSGMKIQGWSATSGSINTGAAMGAIQLPLGSTRARATSNPILGGNLNAATPTSGSGSIYNMTTGVYDSLGNLQSVTLAFTHTGANTWSVSSGGANLTTLTFDPATGQLSSGGSAVLTVPGANGANGANLSLDFSKLTQLSTNSDVATTHQDGLAAGSLTTFFVSSTDGKVYGLYSNGMQELLGQVALAKFVNPSGLERTGQNMFRATFHSGDPSVGIASTGGRGVIASGYLEASNVDMAQEFTNMILAQRGFQASSRVITTSDEMLQELVNLKR